MKFGIREVADVHLEKLSGNGPSSLLLDTAKMTTLEGASTTVYAQGGKGNARLMAWEGEKTLTFTVEDALMTLKSFHALTGTEVEETANGTKFISKTTSFAGYYKITADTLMRDEDGNDHKALIIIPKAKLQTQLSLSLAPSGDPSTFTFTFDAFPNEDDEIFTIEIFDSEYVETETYLRLNDVVYGPVTGDTPSIKVMAVENKANLYLTSSNNEDIEVAIGQDPSRCLTDLVSMYTLQELPSEDGIELTKGETNTWYLI